MQYEQNPSARWNFNFHLFYKHNEHIIPYNGIAKQRLYGFNQLILN